MDEDTISPETLGQKYREFVSAGWVSFDRLAIRSTRVGELQVCVYSRWQYRESITTEEAESDLKNAKAFIAEICSKDKNFNELFGRHSIEFTYLLDYGKGAVLLFKLVGDKAVKA